VEYRSKEIKKIIIMRLKCKRNTVCERSSRRRKRETERVPEGEKDPRILCIHVLR
jgi:hypothetical protein